MSTRRYLVVTECNGTGYVVGYYEDLQEAEKVIDALHCFNDALFNLSVNQLYEQAQDYQKYYVHPSCKFHIENSPRGMSDGVYFSHVIDTTMIHNFSLKQFMFERANTILAFDLEDYSENEERFVRFDLQFMAN